MIYVTSDLHGRKDLFDKLLSAAGFSDGDWLYILGDVIDRHGNGGVDILKWLLFQPNVQLILGNHEAMLLSNRWLFEEINEESVDSVGEGDISTLATWEMNGGSLTMKALAAEPAETRQDILDYLNDCPLMEAVSVNGRDYVLVHSGLGNFSEDKPLADYTSSELLWTRPTPLTRYCPERYTVILGHTPTCYYAEAYKNRMIRSNGWWNIDTGAAMKQGSPMLLRLDDLTEFYVEPDGSVTVLQ